MPHENAYKIYEENNKKILSIAEMICKFDLIMRTHSINSRKENLLSLSVKRFKMNVFSYWQVKSKLRSLQKLEKKDIFLLYLIVY